MKKVVMSAFFCAVVVGITSASSLYTETNLNNDKKETTYEQKAIETFKNKLAFQQQNLHILWEQYDREVARIADSRSAHAEIDRDLAFFIGEYQKDIDSGKHVEESKKAILGLQEAYAQKHALLGQQKESDIARLQVLLKAELSKEKESFKALKKEYSYLINEQTLPLLLQMEQQFASSSHKAVKLEESRNNVLASF